MVLVAFLCVYAGFNLEKARGKMQVKAVKRSGQQQQQQGVGAGSSSSSGKGAATQKGKSPGKSASRKQRKA